eukprot:6188977-Prymnesium_polylepis.1
MEKNEKNTGGDLGVSVPPVAAVPEGTPTNDGAPPASVQEDPPATPVAIEVKKEKKDKDAQSSERKKERKANKKKEKKEKETAAPRKRTHVVSTHVAQPV